MKIKYFLFGFCLLCFLSLKGQEMIISNNSKIYALPSTVIILANGMNLVNNSTAGKLFGTYVFRGSLPQKISGSKAVEFTNLKIEQGAMVSLYNDVKVNSSLYLNGGIINILNNNLTMLSGGLVSGSFNQSNMVVSEGIGKLTYTIAGNGTYLFPIGDTSKIDDYSPVSLLFKTGTYNNAAVSVNLKNNQHPNNLKSSNYLNRYWTISQVGISDFDCEVNFSYTNEDIKGTESNIYGAKWDGSVWIQLNKASLNSISGNVNSFSDFTGADNTLLAREELIQDKVDIFTNGKIIIVKSRDNYKLRTAEIYNKLGQKIYDKDLSKSSYNEIFLDLASDIYLLRILSEYQSFTKKIFIE